LNLAIGARPDTAYELALPAAVRTATAAAPQLSFASIDDLLERAVAARPILASMAASLEVQRANVSIARAEYWPKVYLTNSYRRSSRRFARAWSPPWENFRAHVGLDVSWNLFTGLTTPAAVRRAELQLAKTEATHADLLRRTESQVREEAERYRLFLDVLGLAKDGASSAAEALRLATELYTSGKATALEVRDAELRYTSALLVVNNARYDIEVAKEQLAWAVGEAL